MSNIKFCGTNTQILSFFVYTLRTKNTIPKLSVEFVFTLVFHWYIKTSWKRMIIFWVYHQRDRKWAQMLQQSAKTNHKKLTHFIFYYYFDNFWCENSWGGYLFTSSNIPIWMGNNNYRIKMISLLITEWMPDAVRLCVGFAILLRSCFEVFFGEFTFCKVFFINSFAIHFIV